MGVLTPLPRVNQTAGLHQIGLSVSLKRSCGGVAMQGAKKKSFVGMEKGATNENQTEQR
jgi:hypothetical protein